MQLLEHHLVVLVEGLVDVLEEEVVVREGRIRRLHEVLEVLVVQGWAFLPREGALRVQDLRRVNVRRRTRIRVFKHKDPIF